jgi:hypothetical protein
MENNPINPTQEGGPALTINTNTNNNSPHYTPSSPLNNNHGSISSNNTNNSSTSPRVGSSIYKLPTTRDGSFIAGPVSPLGGAFRSRNSVINASAPRPSMSIRFALPITEESKFSDDDIQARIQDNLTKSTKKDLSKLFGADTNSSKQVIKIDKNAEMRKLVQQKGYRVPSNLSIEQLESLELTNLYYQHRQMPDIMKRRYSEDERAERRREEEDNKAKKAEEGNVSPATNLPHRYHFLLDIKQVMIAIQEPTEMYISIYSSRENRFLSEEYCLQLTESGASVMGVVACKALFVNLSQQDITNNGLKLVLKIYRAGDLVKKDKKELKKKMSIVSGQSSLSTVDSANEVYRRPWGASVIDLNDKIINELIRSIEKEIPSGQRLNETKINRCKRCASLYPVKLTLVE